jgi:WD40 repeat protein
MSRDRFLAEYKYKVEHDFQVNDKPASWAKTPESAKPAHRFWGDEDYKIDIPHASHENHSSFSFAVSPDGQFVATAGGLVVTVYHAATKQCRATFKGLTALCSSLLFGRSVDGKGYRIIVGSGRSHKNGERLLVLELDADGQRLHESKPIGISKLLGQSLDPIKSELERTHGLQSTSTLYTEVEESLNKALENLQASLESKDLTCLEGKLSGFESKSFSADGNLLLYLTCNETTQRGTRDAELLPHIIVWDLREGVQKHSLGGHQDAIMWTAFSPDDQYFASASWDGTFRIYETTTGECKHIIGPTGSQCWSGCWSPDSKHIVLCGMAAEESVDEKEETRRKSYTLVAVYSIETGEKIAQFDRDNLRHWVRNISWSPLGDEIAFAHEGEVWIWKPYDDKIITRFKVKVESRIMVHFASIRKIAWARGGRFWLQTCGDETVEVWDREDNVRWRFERPREAKVPRHAMGIHWFEDTRTVMSLHGDGSLRFWTL